MATPSAPKIPKVEEDEDELAVKSFKLTSEDHVPLVSNMHVSNVPLEATETHVRDVFSVCGPLLRVVVNRPEGFAPKTTSAFVMYKFREDAEFAFSNLAGFKMMGHEIVLAWTENSRTGEKTLSKLRYQASNSDLGLSLEEWQRNFLIDKLKVLTNSRSEIATLMMFCVDQSRFSSEITTIICRTLTDDSENEPEPNRKLAILYLIHDLLSNAQGVADCYKEEFQPRLGEVAVTMKRVTRSSSLGRLTRIKFSSAVSTTFALWDSFFPGFNLQVVQYLYGAGEG